MENKLIIVRHGKTYWNHERRYQGHTDIRLNNEGIKQANDLMRRLTNEKITAIYSSDLIRAQETAEIIAQPHGLKVQTKEALREMNFGVWEGLTFQEIEKKYPKECEAWILKPHELLIPQGESFFMVRDRVLKETQKILKQHEKGNIILVAHGGVNAALICALLDKPLSVMWDYMQKNTAISTFVRKDGKMSLEVFNDYSHLS